MIGAIFTLFFGFWLIFLGAMLVAFVCIAIGGIITALGMLLQRTCGFVLRPIERGLNAFGRVLPGPGPLRGVIAVFLFCAGLIAFAETFGHQHVR